MSDKGKGVLSYLLGFVGGLIVLLGFKDNNKKTCMHAGQAIVISGGTIACNIVFSMLSVISGFEIPFVSFILYILEITLLIIGVVKVLNDDADPKLPVVGDIAEKLFEKTISEAPEFVSSNVVTPKFDPNTGEPIKTVPANAKFDPNTGKPIHNVPANAKFDPETGERLVPANAKFDPNTGKPISVTDEDSKSHDDTTTKDEQPHEEESNSVTEDGKEEKTEE